MPVIGTHMGNTCQREDCCTHAGLLHNVHPDILTFMKEESTRMLISIAYKKEGVNLYSKAGQTKRTGYLL